MTPTQQVLWRRRKAIWARPRGHTTAHLIPATTLWGQVAASACAAVSSDAWAGYGPSRALCGACIDALADVLRGMA